jgi:hypothetical protein
MTGLAVLGGIGRGLQEGSQYVRQRRMDDATLDLRNQQLQLQRDQLDQQTKESDARLSLLNEEAGWKRSDRGRAEAEMQRRGVLDKIVTDTWSELGVDADPLAVNAEIFKRSAASGLARREELEPLIGHAKQFRQRGITAALRTGNMDAVTKAMSDAIGEPVRIQVAPAKDEFGRPDRVFTVVGNDGKPRGSMNTMQIASLLGADDILADEERRVKREEVVSKTEENRAQAGAARAAAGASSAQAGKYRAETEGRRLENEGLAAVDPQRRVTAAKDAPAAVREAEWYRTATAEQRAAFDQVKKLSDDPKVAAEAIRLMATSLDPKTPEQAVADVKRIYELSGSGQSAAAPRPQAGNRPPLTTFNK